MRSVAVEGRKGGADRFCCGEECLVLLLALGLLGSVAGGSSIRIGRRVGLGGPLLVNLSEETQRGLLSLWEWIMVSGPTR